MLYYLLFWAILGFIFHFYIIFWTNLLTGGPAQICCFMPILVFREKGISNGVETERNQLEKLFLEGNTPVGLGPHVRRYSRSPGDRGCAQRGWARSPFSWPPRLLLDLHSKSSGSRLFQKSRSRRFHSVWTPFDMLFLQNTEIGKKNSNLGWASG